MPKKENPQMVTCRKCHCPPYIPSLMRDFYQDDKDGPGTGLCERCMMAEAFSPKPDPVAVTEEQKERLCMTGETTGSSKTCRYLVMSAGYCCAKGSSLQATIDARVQTMRAKGDNCSGPPNFAPTQPTQATQS